MLPVNNPLTGARHVEIDDADVALSRAVIHVALAQIALEQLYNVDVDLRDVVQRAQDYTLHLPDDLLKPYPAFLHLRDPEQARQAKEALIAAIDQYLVAENLIHGETDDQRDDLFAFSDLPEDVRKEQAFHQAAVDLRRSLVGMSDPTWTLTLDRFLHLGDFFDRPLDLRALETGKGVQDALLAYLGYQSQRALMNLEKAPATFSQQVDPAVYGIRSSHPLEIDYGDLLLARAALESLNTALAVIASYDVDVNVPTIAMAAAKGSLDVERDLLTPYPHLLRLQNFSHLSETRLTARSAMEAALEASRYVRTLDDPDQRDDLFRLEGNVARQEARWRPYVEQLHDSFKTIIDPDLERMGDEFHVDLNPLFATPKDPRDYLPQFHGIVPVRGTLPDPTLGGLLPDATQENWQ